ncbi:MAG TPA: glutathione transferase GstA [Steroidobacteraceae bacterium]|nr:glutathione transferase GstA [Steroidobacteraceae bacterium]
MKLYYAKGTCALSPHIALLEAGLKFELEKVDIRAKKLADGGDYLQVNPKGYVPALKTDDGKILTEGPAIVQYIADRKPDSGLAPACGTFERSQLQEWLNFIGTEIHKNFSPQFNPSLSQDVKDYARGNLTKRFDYLNKLLEGRRFLLGERFTVADGYLYTVLSWAKPLGIDLSRWPALAAYHAGIGARPKVQEAQQAEA